MFELITEKWHQLIFIVIDFLSKCGGLIEEIKGKFDSAAYKQFLEKHVS
jgi:hypothetical protein